MRIRSLHYNSIEPSKLAHQLRNFTVIAGENGSGKSRILHAIAVEAIANREKIIAISNSSHHRFNGLGKKCQVLAPRRKGSAPESVLKSAIRSAQEEDEIRLRSISRILRHCGYSPSVGLKIIKTRHYFVASELREKIDNLAKKRGREKEDLESAAFRLSNIRNDDIHWLDFDGLTFDVSKEKILTRILFWEDELVALGLMKPASLYLHSLENIFELKQASSGEISLITSIAFIAANISKLKFLLIDEPENSLHPQWQRDYIDLLMGAIGYSRVRTVVATHSPMLVMGIEPLEMEKDLIVLSRVMTNSQLIDSDSLEAVMAKVFMVVTPRNHFLSQHLVKILNDLEDGTVSLSDVINVIEELRSAGVDSKQMIALEMVEKMAHSIYGRRNDIRESHL